MFKIKRFVLSYLSVFAFIVFFQLQWARNEDRYNDIFLRFFLSLVIAAPVFYLLVQILHCAKSIVSKRTYDISVTMQMLYPLSVFHLQWFQFVSDYKWPYTSALVSGLSGLALVMTIIRSVARGLPRELDRSGVFSRVKTSFFSVNAYFSQSLVRFFQIVGNALKNPVGIAGITFYPVTWFLLTMQLVVIVKFSAFSIPHPFLFPVNVF
jgi:hypothetical protein